MNSDGAALALKLQEAEREAAFVRLLEAYRAIQPQLALCAQTAENFPTAGTYVVGAPAAIKPTLALKEKVINIRAALVEGQELCDLLLRYYDQYHAVLVEGALMDDKKIPGT